jgi:hypothetical protein
MEIQYISMRNNYLEGKREKQSRHYFNQNLQGQINQMERGH